MSKKESNFVSHQGIVKDLTPHSVVVDFINFSSCSSCHAKGACGISSDKIKEIEVELMPGQYFEIGESVNIKLKSTLGYKALWISYLIPLIVLVLLLLSLPLIGASELLTALLIVVAIALYYTAVWLLRGKLEREFIFVVEKV